MVRWPAHGAKRRRSARRPPPGRSPPVKRALGALALVALLAAVLAAGVVAGHVRGVFVTDRPPAELDALLAPHDEVFRPRGEGPFPAVVIVHGCGGLRESLRQWAATLRDAGYLVVAIDSFGPRRLDWPSVCGGRALLGNERAGDVWLAFDRVRRRADVDPARVVLAGWSHGAWSIMELFALREGETPPGLAAAPAAPRREAAALVLFYPYCGRVASARSRWPAAPPTLMLLAGQDTIVSSEACARWAGAHAGVTAHVYPGVDHGFDQAVPSGEWALTWDEDAGRDARRRVLAFLGEHLGPAVPRP